MTFARLPACGRRRRWPSHRAPPGFCCRLWGYNQRVARSKLPTLPEKETPDEILDCLAGSSAACRLRIDLVAAARRRHFQRLCFRTGVRAHRRGRPVRDEPRNEAVPEHHDRSGRKGQGRAAGTVRSAVQQGPAQARIRLRQHPQRRAGVRGAFRELPVAGHHDGGLRQGHGTAGHLPERIPGRILGAQRRRPFLHRSRQRDAGTACDPAHQFDQSAGSPGRDRPDDRFSAAAGTPGLEHAGDRRADHRRHVSQQPRRRVVHRRAAG